MKTFFNYDLSHHNTLGLLSQSDIFIVLEQKEDIVEALKMHGKPAYILGGGSNVVLPEVLHGVTWHPLFKMHSYVKKGDMIHCSIEAGNNRHEIVKYTIDQGRRGIENLIAIPGDVGAAPVQNIGAYGVELSDIFQSVTVYDLDSNNFVSLDKKDCVFGYRSSIFKQSPGRYCIIDITLEFSTIPKPILTYKPLSDHFLQGGNTTPSQREIASVIESIRRSKLPNPDILGNCGSFFQNPVLPISTIERLLAQYPTIPHYSINDISEKVSAAWLIEQAGLKGYKQGNIGTYEKQPLVIVHYGGGNGKDIKDFSDYIIQEVEKKFGVILQREANIW